MHLADRRRSDRIGIELDEELVDRAAEFTLDRRDRQLDRHRRGVRLQLRQREPQWLGQSVVEVAGHLAELHQGTLHVPQFVGDLLGRAQLSVAVQFLTTLRRRERLAGRRGGVGGADPGAHPGEARVATQARSMNGVTRTVPSPNSQRDQTSEREQ